MPTVRAFMTACPYTVGADQTVSYAHTLLYQHRVRQLPVLSGGQLAGLLYERDLTLIATLREPDLNRIKVEEVMSLSIYKVGPDAPLDQVASEMASKKFGAAIVVEDNEVVGIFTTVDACNALVTVLKQAYAG
jgi:CBS domain-containing protein